MGTRRVLIAIAALTAVRLNAHAAPSAEKLYNEGQAAYDQGDYARAIEKWERSYQLSDASGLLMNIAQAYRLAGDCSRALSAYRQFLALDKTAAERSLAEDLVRELEPECGGAASPAETEHQGASALKLYGLVTGGAGAALLLTGLAVGIHASDLADEVTAACSSSSGCDWNDALRSKDAAGRRDAKIGYALDAVGIAGIAGGAVLYYLGTRQPAVTVSPRGQGDGAVITWSGSW